MPQAINKPKRLQVGEAALFFAGQPPELMGHLEVRNLSQECFKVRDVSLKNLQLKGPRSARLELARTLTKIEPGESVRVPVRLQVSLETQPGVYDGHIECDGKLRDVRVQVLESWRLELLPVARSFKVRSKEPIRATVRVTNTGNMPYTLHHTIEFTWEEKRCAQQSFLAQLAHAPKGVKSEHSKSEGELEGTLAIKARQRLLNPGETRDVELEIAVPERLRPGRLYCGCVAFEQARLQLDLEILADAEEKVK
jgi:uncharacterized membrane protein